MSIYNKDNCRSEEHKSELFSDSIWSDIPPSISESDYATDNDFEQALSEKLENEPLQVDSFEAYFKKAMMTPPARRKSFCRKPEPKLSSFCKQKRQSKITSDISGEDSISDNEVDSADLKPEDCFRPAKPQKKRKKRRDVIFKKILRECRRFYQTQLTDLTGFIASKKPRKDDYMYACMRRFNTEVLKKQGTFEENFYLACLLYQQDLSRNIDTFLAKIDDLDMDTARKLYRSIIHKIHDTLYKYSHDKLDFFVSKSEMSSLFLYFYQNGAGEDRVNPKYVEEYDFIKNK
mmetsp:Transcript_12526/g.14347  ORF Transcript_12526/g.14347 Transcript_12526/m.14347 type:complete len:290 (+) Transcript_12526:185-1054(+)